MPQFSDGWDQLYLSFKVEWPLGLIITQPLLLRYVGLFQFLLKLKRVQLELEEAWQIMCRSVNSVDKAADVLCLASVSVTVTEWDERKDRLVSS